MAGPRLGSKANGSDEPPSFDELPRAEKARRRQENVRAIIDRATSKVLRADASRLQELLLERAGIEATTAALQQDLLKLGVRPSPAEGWDRVIPPVR